MKIDAAEFGSVLVTGAGGFVGGRICEVLSREGVDVRAGLRRWGSGARVGRSTAQLVFCDVMDPESIDQALDGVDRIVHCAVGDHSVTVEGTRNILAAAQRADIQRVVHISTIDVYGDVSGEVAEDSPLQRTGNEYGANKIGAEEVCWEFVAQGLPVSVLRPSLIYGPFSESWTIEWAMRLQARPWLLSAEDCQGVCNLVYVDDLVQAVSRALVHDAAVGQAFNINGGERPTWHEYFEALNRGLALPPLISQSRAVSHISAQVIQPIRGFAKFLLARFEDQIMAVYQRFALAKTVMLFAEGLIKKTPTTGEFELLTKRASFSTTKATELLGYAPQIGLQTGISHSVDWLRHHGYVQSNPLV